MHGVKPLLVVLTIFCSGALAQVSSETNEESRADGQRSEPDLKPQGIVPFSRSQDVTASEPSVNWKGLRNQSAILLGVQHGFRLWTEPGTREGLKGPFFDGYGRSLGAMHGWSDGDPFYVNYVGHPMQGAAAAYIWIHNDPKYRNAQFGKNRAYWMSRARAAAFSFGFSAQFEGGPVSEASLGNIQAYYPQQGFVDWVVTPVFGMGWVLAEDALDRYVIERLERKIANPYVRILFRGWLNPSRSFANMIAGRVPWYREYRAGVWTYDPNALDPKNPRHGAEIMLPDPKGPAPFELATNFSGTTFLGAASGATCLGGGAVGAFRMSRSWQTVVDVGGCKLLNTGPRLSGDVFTYMAGPRWSSAGARWSRHIQVVVGGQKVTHDRANNPQVSGEPANLDERHGFTLGAGGGLSYKVNRALAFEVATLEYRRSWMTPLNGIDYRRGLRFSTGVTLRMGSW